MVLNQAATCFGDSGRQSLLHKVQALLQGNYTAVYLSIPSHNLKEPNLNTKGSVKATSLNMLYNCKRMIAGP